MICRNGGLIGAITNGGFAEYIEYVKGACSRYHII
jgi:D-arabinose 1-dehydrogenase-like Zn-dependent alcohol dehydrogenase